jgi:hypothetical protein
LVKQKALLPFGSRAVKIETKLFSRAMPRAKPQVQQNNARNQIFGATNNFSVRAVRPHNAGR